MFAKKLLLPLVLCFTFISCEKNKEFDIDPILPTGPIIPLAEGNEWFYKFYENGIHHDTIISMVRGELILEQDGHQYNSYVYGNIKYQKSGYFYSRDDSENVILVGVYQENDTLILPSLYLKYPVSEGEKWSSNSLFLMGSSPSIIECIDESKMVTIDSTDFPCVVYKENFKIYGELPANRIIYATPGIGVVIEVTSFNDRNDSLVLYSYIVNKHMSLH